MADFEPRVPTPYYARNRHPAPQHPSSGSPHEWLADTNLRGVALRGLSFDFFIDWSRNSVGDEVWLKRTVPPDVDPWPCSLDALRSALSSADRLDVLLAARFLRGYGMRARYIAFPDPTDWSTQPRPIVSADIREDGELTNLSVWSIADLAGEIASATGRDIRVAAMAITTSDLEAHLASGTGTPWPGDVDRLLMDGATGEAKAIVEFKKHTLAAPIEDYTFARYYRPGTGAAGVKTSDRLKWDRLCFLAKRLAPDNWLRGDGPQHAGGLPIIALYFPTSPGHDSVLLEQITGECGELVVGRRSRATLPTAGNRDSQMSVVKAIRELI